MSGETEQQVSGWTVSTLNQYMNDLIVQMDRRYQERFEAQTKALDAAFLAQQTAMQAALLAAEKAVQTALSAAEKAVTKAEIANEKRFDSVNEFRSTLSDQASRLMPRTESEARLGSIAEKVDSTVIVMTERLNSLELRLNDKANANATRIEKIESISKGVGASWGVFVGAGGLLLTIVAIAITIITLSK